MTVRMFVRGASIYLSAAVLLLASSASAQIIFAQDPTPRVTVAGMGAVEAQPDTATVILGVYVLDRDLHKAKAASDASVVRLLDVTKSLALDPRDVASSVLSIEPKYSDAPKPEFLGYEVSRSVTVTLRDLSKLDQLVDHAIDAGANRQFNVELTSSHLNELQDRAMALAVDDAKAQANRLASGFGAKLGPIRQIGPSSGSNTMRMASAATVHFGSGTFAAGTITVKSEISVTFLLEQ
jgi:uncharacterized protein YggE